MEGTEEKPGEHSCRDLFQAFPVHHLAAAETDGAGENAESSYAEEGETMFQEFRDRR
jgi:hypothetical protein